MTGYCSRGRHFEITLDNVPHMAADRKTWCGRGQFIVHTALTVTMMTTDTIIRLCKFSALHVTVKKRNMLLCQCTHCQMQCGVVAMYTSMLSACHTAYDVDTCNFHTRLVVALNSTRMDAMSQNATHTSHKIYRIKNDKIHMFQTFPGFK